MAEHTSRRERRALARAEVWLQIAVTVQRWATYPVGSPDDPDDPLDAIQRTYELTNQDMTALLTAIAQEAEARAIRAGYDRSWDWRPPDPAAPQTQ